MDYYIRSTWWPLDCAREVKIREEGESKIVSSKEW
jgi:hypothetical protein